MLGLVARAFTNARAMLRPAISLRKPLHWYIQSLCELRDGFGGSRTAPTFEIGQITLTNTCFEIQMQLRLAAPVTNGFQSTLTSKNRSTNLRGQHDAAGSQFGFPSIVDSDIVGILGLVIGAVEECLIFGPGQHHQLFAAGRPNDLWCAHSLSSSCKSSWPGGRCRSPGSWLHPHRRSPGSCQCGGGSHRGPEGPSRRLGPSWRSGEAQLPPAHDRRGEGRRYLSRRSA